MTDSRRLLTPVEVGRMFRVDPRTVGRWVNAGKIAAIRTPGGRIRVYEDDARALLQGGQ